MEKNKILTLNSICQTDKRAKCKRQNYKADKRWKLSYNS